jgi:hypothetical protein
MVGLCCDLSDGSWTAGLPSQRLKFESLEIIRLKENVGEGPGDCRPMRGPGLDLSNF